MIYKILVFFGIVSNKTITSKSQSIVDVFTKTQEDLKGLNEIIEKQRLKKEAEIKRLTDETNELGVLRAKHSAVISKIDKIFEP